MITYIDTEKVFSDSLGAELEARGIIFSSIGASTRRIIGGKVEKGHPRALTVQGDNLDKAVIKEVLDAHVPYFGHVTAKIAEVKAEANRRILDRMPDFKQRNYIAFNLEMEKKERKGGTLTTEELAMVTFTEGEWEFAKAIRSASNVIEAEIALLTDVEAGVFDLENHIKWNV